MLLVARRVESSSSLSRGPECVRHPKCEWNASRRSQGCVLVQLESRSRMRMASRLLMECSLSLADQGNVTVEKLQTQGNQADSEVACAGLRATPFSINSSPCTRTTFSSPGLRHCEHITSGSRRPSPCARALGPSSQDVRSPPAQPLRARHRWFLIIVSVRSRALCQACEAVF